MHSKKTGLCLLLILGLTLISFFPVLNNKFLIGDDEAYLLNNPSIRAINLPNIKKIFTTTVLGTYNPLVSLSFAIEYNFLK